MGGKSAIMQLRKWLMQMVGKVMQLVWPQPLAGTAALLQLLPPERAHEVGLWCMSQHQVWQQLPVLGAARLDLSMEVPGLGRIRHPIGLAAGFDKNGRAITGLSRLGFTMIEIGTITPTAQRGRPQPRMFRYRDTRDLINRMGFPSDGAEAVLHRLRCQDAREDYLLGINVGKNQTTALERALDDYLACLDKLKGWGDYYVVNVSSPNTPGLRELACPAFFKDLARRLSELESGLPRKVWIKLDPDAGRLEFQALIQAIAEEAFGGVILTNTRKVQFPEAGGLSGHSLRSYALQRLMWAQEVRQHGLGILAVGGITSGADVLESIRLGAHAVGLYSALVFRGPAVVAKMLAELEGLMAARGMVHLADARQAAPGDFISADDTGPV